MPLYLHNPPAREGLKGNATIMSTDREKPQCLSLTKAGGVCKASPTASGYCPWHSPDFSREEKQSWSRRGALSNRRKHTTKAIEVAVATLPAIPDLALPSFATKESVRGYLERVSAMVEHRVLAPSQAQAVALLAGLAVKLAEMQLEQDLIDAEAEAARRPAQTPFRFLP